MGIAPPNKSASHRPDLVGRRFGAMRVVSPDLIWRKKGRWDRAHVSCRCEGCGSMFVRDLAKLQVEPPMHGCRDCYLKAAASARLERAPEWLVRRAKSMKSRCENSSHIAFADYGARGIEFRFPSPRSCAEWVKANLGLPPQDRNTQLDRIDNEGHYEPGNLRWASKALNCNNTRRGGWVAMMHRFRIEYPDVHYADKTLRNLFAAGLTFKEVEDRFYQPSDKPKGVYGTFSKPDPVIASLAKDC